MEYVCPAAVPDTDTVRQIGFSEVFYARFDLPGAAASPLIGGLAAECARQNHTLGGRQYAARPTWPKRL